MFRVGADRADHHGLGDVGGAGCLDHIGAEHQILEVEGRGRLPVGADPADAGCEVDDTVGPRLDDRSIGGGPVEEIDLGTRRSQDIGDPAGRQRGMHGAAEKSAATGDQNSLLFERGCHQLGSYLENNNRERSAS